MEYEDIIKETDEELVKHIFGHFNNQQADTRQAELIRRQIGAINELNSSINNLNETTARYNWWLISLSVIIAVLTFVMLVKMFIK